ncbi:hypothetical protein ROHU_037027 [Labeo rohita]|uniref:Uncharacterized protein n=1 Tax=Labeo rohita TaxID=84645 RepID=A0A498MCX0_LABRO|nr:hypothetical protein ROHU_035684 [Labeo rohita]RXN04736.1 hypothetical protein ROHU_035685 [Labeo rohita]RXN16956.1 hypothetical protein ROHU_037027 [Labeo rohita]
MGIRILPPPLKEEWKARLRMLVDLWQKGMQTTPCLLRRWTLVVLEDTTLGVSILVVLEDMTLGISSLVVLGDSVGLKSSGPRGHDAGGLKSGGPGGPNSGGISSLVVLEDLTPVVSEVITELPKFAAAVIKKTVFAINLYAVLWAWAALEFTPQSTVHSSPESTPEPAPDHEFLQSTPEPTPVHEFSESTPEPALVQEHSEPAPESTPVQES